MASAGGIESFNTESVFKGFHPMIYVASAGVCSVWYPALSSLCCSPVSVAWSCLPTMPSLAVTPRMRDIYTTTTRYKEFSIFATTLQWRHNRCSGVSNYQPHDCLLNLLFRRRSTKTSKLRVTGLCAGNSPVTGEFPTQMASNAENIPIWWRNRGRG